MTDPLADVVTLLQPRMTYSKIAVGAGRWRVRCPEGRDPMFFVMLHGAARLLPQGLDPVTVETGDFVLIPNRLPFTMSSLDPLPEDEECADPVCMPNGEMRIGELEGEAEHRMLIGHCELGSPDTALLVSLLPRLVHVRDEARLSVLVSAVVDEARSQRPAREVVLERLLELMLIEALRSSRDAVASPGLLRGLSDERLALALRGFHQAPGDSWTVALLARMSAMSRTTFFERFSRAVGVPPMEYVLAWRMALAKKLLRRGEGPIADVAAQVGYSSPSTFTVAFTRHVGVAPGRFARAR
ncbi:helix-turn-helix domain-containing protein [Xylophilus rhododendri]|uniref:Helix-turn-helix domain-containing protein n=1 Tax=Xylophilus rhododendri TaxID=2697032 RepID=A0A857J3C3_9BURK|nr:AraC family transcriptional regulator [Xylophilus rhododendri]QHI97753.1 helix-turn-helix domain-containing protein [Xylophilus rhododendri]